MSQPTPEVFPTAGGNYIQHADGRLERVDDAPPAPAAEPAAEPAPPATRPSRGKTATPE
jgi:hypothetical protein